MASMQHIDLQGPFPRPCHNRLSVDMHTTYDTTYASHTHTLHLGVNRQTFYSFSSPPRFSFTATSDCVPYMEKAPTVWPVIIDFGEANL